VDGRVVCKGTDDCCVGLQKLNETDPRPDIEVEWDNLQNIINDVAHDEDGVRINIKKFQCGLMKIVEKQLKQRMKQERNV
jgi:hypothetical protein